MHVSIDRLLKAVCLRLTLGRGWNAASTFSANLRHTNSVLCFLNWIVRMVATFGGTLNTHGTLSKSAWHFHDLLPKGRPEKRYGLWGQGVWLYTLTCSYGDCIPMALDHMCEWTTTADILYIKCGSSMHTVRFVFKIVEVMHVTLTSDSFRMLLGL